MTQTRLDRAHSAMGDAPEDDAARLHFYEALADAEMYLLLEREAVDDRAEPRILTLDDGRFALAFDTEERLVDFTRAPAAHVALPGRVLVRLLADEGVGLGLNLGVAPSEALLPADALQWLVQMLDQRPDARTGIPTEIAPPSALPDRLLQALDAKLAGLAGLARAAHLVWVRYKDGRSGHLLAFQGAPARAEQPLAKAVSEAVIFSGVDQATLDVVFLPQDSPLLPRFQAVSLRFDLPEPKEETAQILGPAAPGMDPKRPPRLK
ncbi:type III secretion system (T3SS) SseB-like protein [Albidovulum inexpectatum]|uniref:Type III secretion system (T3SS) SseB-like protein n=1 Tax=Albidovulum inexpectatum TaxID=196587 RepID=A0A2S5JKU6_9RHOB|nr:SseB family protein [Albidovulum inexpectatum]PPB82109.1 type III secretion system (T3SS) SseB-like protein [Albidovulum inexpectatum]